MKSKAINFWGITKLTQEISEDNDGDLIIGDKAKIFHSTRSTFKTFKASKGMTILALMATLIKIIKITM